MKVSSVLAMYNLTTLAKNIKARLGDRSESWLAGETGIPQQTLNRWLKDPGKMRVADLQRIAEALGTTADDLWTGRANN